MKSSSLCFSLALCFGTLFSIPHYAELPLSPSKNTTSPTTPSARPTPILIDPPPATPPPFKKNGKKATYKTGTALILTTLVAAALGLIVSGSDTGKDANAHP